MIFQPFRRALLPALSIFALLAAAQAADVKSGSRSDAEALLRNVKAPAGFKVTLFAAPPEVAYPVCLAAAVTGEVFIGIDENGSLGTSAFDRERNGLATAACCGRKYSQTPPRK